MTDLGVKEQFVEGVIAGTKPFTLRRAWKNGRTPDTGTKLRLITGHRTPERRVVASCVVGFRATVGFTQYGFVEVKDWRSMRADLPWSDIVRAALNHAVATVETNTPSEACERLAHLDGFVSYPEFWKFHADRRPPKAPPCVRRELIGFAYVTEEFTNA